MGESRIVTLGSGADVLAIGSHYWDAGNPGTVRVANFINGMGGADPAGA